VLRRTARFKDCGRGMEPAWLSAGYLLIALALVTFDAPSLE